MPPEPAKRPKDIELHPSEWDPDWQPPIGNDLLPGEKPHIWQEFKRDLHMRRDYSAPLVGRGWPILIGVFVSIFVGLLIENGEGAAILIALKQLF